LVGVVVFIAAGACSTAAQDRPVCSQTDEAIFVLEAQSVPSATRLPCIAELPIGWQFAGSLVQNDKTVLWLDHDRGGIHAVEATLQPTCDISSAVEVPPAPDEVGMRIYEEPTSLQPSFTGTRLLVFDGGCISYRYTFASGAEPTLAIEADQALSTVARSSIVSLVNDKFGLSLCGAGAPACER